MNTNDWQGFTGVTREVHYIGQLVRENRMVRAFEEGAARYPIYRKRKAGMGMGFYYIFGWQTRGWFRHSGE